MTKIDISKIDSAMATKPANENGVKWYLPFETPMTLLGLPWFDKNASYERLPIERTNTVTQFPNGEKTTVPAENCGAFILSAHTAGVQARFRTNSTRFLIQGVLRESLRMDHMALTGSDGFDIYFKEEHGWQFYGVTRTDHKTDDFATTICNNLKHEMRDVIINFPLYNGVKSVFIGLDENATVEPPTPFKDPRPVVFYGTSITQGGCATRPGMCSSNILSRMLERQVINLGFSGSGKGEPELANMLAAIKDPALYIVDYCWNVGPAELECTLPNMLDTIRNNHPHTPVLLVAPTPGLGMLKGFEKPNQTFLQRADIMRDEACRRNQNGDPNVYFFDALHDSLGIEPLEGTVDGVHLTDFGFYMFSKAILPHIRQILE